MSLAQDDDDGIITGINVTPLVDITLVLLIVFMVTAKFIVSQSMTIDLPKAASSQSIQLVLGVELNEGGEVKVNGQPANDDRAITAKARESLRANPDVRAVIRADHRVRHGRVVRVLDLLKQAGVTKIAFGVNPTASDPDVAVPAEQAAAKDNGAARDDSVGIQSEVDSPTKRARLGT